MRKQIMSIAVAAALFTTGTMAFDSYADKIATDASGTIVYSTYTDSEEKLDAPLKKSMTQKGDALIYPYFTTEAGYSSEVVVRNTSKDAVVAKVVFYSGKDSKELRDFNIYLSGYDVFRFTVTANGDTEATITSKDGSVITQGILERDPIDVTKTATDYTSLKFASDKAGEAFTAPLSEQRGYIAVFGMVQSSDYNTYTSTNPQGLAFHNKHADLYAGYAALLDDERGTDWRFWRNADGLLNPKYMVGSMFANDANVTAPNRLVGDEETTWSTKRGIADNRAATFKGVDAVLTGHINLKNDGTGNDMLLTATALQNFSEGNHTLVWTPGEYAAIADRCIEDDHYNVECVNTDAKEFIVSSATYTYANHGSFDLADNRVYITQPYKRILLQIDSDTNHGYTYKSNKTTKSVETGFKSFFQSQAQVFDENERTTAEKVIVTRNNTVGAALSGNGIGSTPPPVDPDGYHKELEMLNASAFELNEDQDIKTDFGKGNGFAKFNVGVSAIITQMTASKAGSSLETNWVYSDTEK